MSISIKYIPKTLNEMYGIDNIIDGLKNWRKSVEKGESNNVILLHGNYGCGKTTIAEIMIKYFNPDKSDILRLNTADARGIDNSRSIIELVRYKPFKDKRIIILNECHQATKDFQNNLLELLEKPPEHTIFILCTTEPEKLLKTFRSRALSFKVDTLGRGDCAKLIKDICKKEEKEITGKEIKYIWEVSNGIPRNICNLLEKKFYGNLAGTIEEDEKLTLDLCRSLLGNNWDEIKGVLRNIKVEPESVRYAVLGYMNTVLLNDKENREDFIGGIIDLFSESFIYSKKAGLSLACYLTIKL